MIGSKGPGASGSDNIDWLVLKGLVLLEVTTLIGSKGPGLL